MAGELTGEQRCSCRATPGSCRCDLPGAEGRKGAVARGEGRNICRDDRSVERSNLSAFKPTHCRDLSAAERRSARRQRFVVRAGRRHLLCPSRHSLRSAWSRGALWLLRSSLRSPDPSPSARAHLPMGRAHPQGAVTLLRYSALKTSTCLYLFYMVKFP